MNWNLMLRRVSAVSWCGYVLFVVMYDREEHFSVPLQPLELLWQIPLLLLGCHLCYRATCWAINILIPRSSKSPRSRVTTHITR
jgi:hypothetical protein